MIEQITLGIIQGITEWLPVSSEGFIVLAKTHFFNNSEGFDVIIRQALFLHFGTFLAALIYFRQDIEKLFKALFQYRLQSEGTQKLLTFLIISTIISGLLGFGLIKIFSYFANQFNTQSKLITLVIGCLLLTTACLELRANKGGYREFKDLRFTDGILLGFAQGFAALPGLSRSGLTVSFLLLRKLDKVYALKLSFLMSLPIVLGGNIGMNLGNIVWSSKALVGLFFSFIFGLATIHLFLKIAEKVNFGYFVLIFGVLTILSVVI